MFCNFLSSIYNISNELTAAYFLRGCFGNEFHPEKNRDLLQLIGNDEKIWEYYRDLNGIDSGSAQNQFVHQLAQCNNYGMTHLEMKNTLNDTVFLGLNHQGIHCRSLLRNDLQVETCWTQITSISSNKQRQITVTIKQGNSNVRTLIFYTDSTHYNRYCFRLLQFFHNSFRHTSTMELPTIPKLPTPPLKKRRSSSRSKCSRSSF